MIASDTATLIPPAIYEVIAQSQTTEAYARTAARGFAPSVTHTAWRSVIARNLAAIAGLQPGWDGPSSKPISKRLIYRADWLLRDALDGVTAAVPPYIIPRADGALQFEWATEAFELEFAITEDGRKSFWLCNRRSGVEFEEQGDAATEQLFRWAGRMAPEISNGANVSVPANTETIEVVA